MKILHPCSSPGQTANSILFPSGGTGLNFTIDIIAIEKGKGLWPLLGRGGKSPDVQEKSQRQNA